MNYFAYFLIVFIIFCFDVRRVSLEIERNRKINFKDKLFENKDFISDLEQCKKQIGPYDNDYLNCIEDLSSKPDQEDISCCFRVVQFMCYKTLLTTKCNTSKEDVDLNEQVHFNFWNQLNISELSGNCEGDSVQSTKLCHLEGNHTDNEFLSKIQNCVTQIGTNDNDYNKCLSDEASKMSLNHPYFDSKSQCCSRLVNYNCMKESLISKCSVSEEDVQKFDDVHFNYWNTIGIVGAPNNCKDGAQESIKYCSSVSKITWSNTIQLTVTFILYLLAFKL